MTPTLIGLLPILVWGIAIPVFRLIQDQIGFFAATGIVTFGVAALSMINQLRRPRDKWPARDVVKNPLFYARWIFFVLHEGLLITGINLVQKDHLPFLILINYLWPTAIIICSILFADVRITRLWAFVAGSLIVLTSMAIEIAGPQGFSLSLFDRTQDCIAYLLVFIGAISWGLYSALSRHAGDEAGGSFVTPLFLLTLALTLPVSFIPGYATWGHLSALGLLAIAGYAFLQFLAYLTWDYSVRHGSIVILSLMSDFIPWLSLMMASLLLGVGIGGKTVLSAVTLVAGAMLTRYGTLLKKAKAEDRLD